MAGEARKAERAEAAAGGQRRTSAERRRAAGGKPPGWKTAAFADRKRRGDGDAITIMECGTGDQPFFKVGSAKKRSGASLTSL
eukprot:5106208-Pyramimonas_sp.AAC.1